MSYLKRSISALLLVMLTVIPLKLSAASDFRIEILERDGSYVETVRHTRIKGNIIYNNVSSRQIINYIGLNMKDNPDFSIVVGDGYMKHGWGMSNLQDQIHSTNLRYPNSKVIAGVNGDFYNMSNGIPIGAYVKDYEVLYEGVDYERTLVGFKDNGEMVFGKPTFEGYEVMVFDEDGSRKLHQLKVNGFNRLPGENETTVLFTDFEGPIESELNKMVFEGIDVKTDGSKQHYFAKGKLNSITKETINVPNYGFVIMGDKVFEEGLITENDTVIVQQKLGGKFEGVRHALAGAEHLVINGVPQTTFGYPSAAAEHRAPRTAVGVKADGTVFFVTIDGRQQHNHMEGTKAAETAEIMAYFGAVDAINLDGGGSTTMALLNLETGQYDIKNSPSDNPLAGTLRRNANGIFFLKGKLEEPIPPVPFPDTRPVLTVPQNIMIDYYGNLMFLGVEHADHYEVLVGSKKYITDKQTVKLDLDPGIHEIKIRAFGDHLTHKQSPYSEPFIMTTYSIGIQGLIDGLLEYARSINADINKEE